MQHQICRQAVAGTTAWDHSKCTCIWEAGWRTKRPTSLAAGFQAANMMTQRCLKERAKWPASEPACAAQVLFLRISSTHTHTHMSKTYENSRYSIHKWHLNHLSHTQARPPCLPFNIPSHSFSSLQLMPAFSWPGRKTFRTEKAVSLQVPPNLRQLHRCLVFSCCSLECLGLDCNPESQASPG